MFGQSKYYGKYFFSENKFLTNEENDFYNESKENIS